MLVAETILRSGRNRNLQPDEKEEVKALKGGELHSREKQIHDFGSEDVSGDL